MAKVKVKAHVHAYKTERYDPQTGDWIPGIEYQIYPFEMPSDDRVVICEQDVTVEIPDNFDIRSGLVANLEEQKRKVQAEFGARIAALNAQIQSLLAIENSPSEVIS